VHEVIDQFRHPYAALDRGIVFKGEMRSPFRVSSRETRVWRTRAASRPAILLASSRPRTRHEHARVAQIRETSTPVP
jgi:hypothetical protein